MIIESPGMDHHKALSLEWHIKYPTCRKPRPKDYNGTNGRLSSLPLVFSHRKFKDMHFIVHVAEPYYEKALRYVLGGKENNGQSNIELRLMSFGLSSESVMSHQENKEQSGNLNEEEPGGTDIEPEEEQTDDPCSHD